MQETDEETLLMPKELTITGELEHEGFNSLLLYFRKRH
jgi:hypothetical protein